MSQTVASLRESTLDKIGDFLYKEGFSSSGALKEGILELINLISDYCEEGNHLYPEILITDSLELLKTIPNRELLIYDGKLLSSEFKQAIKLCAPLALSNWNIFIEVKGNGLKYGLVSAEITETSLSMYRQVVEMPNEGYKIAYLRNIGNKTVELRSFNNQCFISLTLNETKQILRNEVAELASMISKDCDANQKAQVEIFIEKLINEAIHTGHGNLIAVISKNDEYIARIKKILSGGVFLQRAIDIPSLINRAIELQKNTTSIEVKAFSFVAISMLNHDGITIFTTKGEILGYHFIIDNKLAGDNTIIGGARTRAFEAMKNSEAVISCFMKSQDGNIKFYKKDE